MAEPQTDKGFYRIGFGSHYYWNVCISFGPSGKVILSNKSSDFEHVFKVIIKIRVLLLFIYTIALWLNVALIKKLDCIPPYYLLKYRNYKTDRIAILIKEHNIVCNICLHTDDHSMSFRHYHFSSFKNIIFCTGWGLVTLSF